MAEERGDAVRYTTRVVGSLPLVRGLIKRAGFGEIIDRVCPADPQTLLSYGRVAEVLVANRLSAPRPLYEVQGWAEQAGVRQVFGIRPDLLNDDRLARTLDVLAEHGAELKGTISLAIAREFGIALTQLHFDLTTVYVEGDYAEEEPEAIRIVYAKDNAWDAAQKGFRVGVSTFEDGKGPVSLNYQALDGNVGTAEAALRNMEEVRKVLGQRVDRVLQVSDRAGITAEVLAKAAQESFDVLGPLTLNEALQRTVRDLLKGNPSWETMSYRPGRQAARPPEQQDGYRAFEIPWKFVYEGQQHAARLLVIHSDGKLKRQTKTRQKRQQRIEKDLTQLRARVGQPRWTPKKIRAGVGRVLSRWPEGALYDVVWEGTSDDPTAFRWEVNSARLEDARTLDGIYAAVATLPKEHHSLDSVFCRLKHQYVVEDSHRILKGPLRITPVFLQRPGRIEGLVFALWLSLVCYQVLQREFRQRVDDERRLWTTRVLLKIFESYGYVGILRGAECRWVPSELDALQRDVLLVLGLPFPEVNTS